MNKILTFLCLALLTACNYTPTLKVYEDDALIFESNQIAAKDTTIYFTSHSITFRVVKDELSGEIDDAQDEDGSFKSYTNVEVYFYSNGTYQVSSGIN
ncbi:MAG: hypothetical protein LRY27_04330 [Chitinophagales bacterium]|nr:hypothetical protein [Chitinophagales bacterium]